SWPTRRRSRSPAYRLPPPLRARTGRPRSSAEGGREELSLNQPVATPRTLGRYEIQAEIGRGMMGVVYKAADPALDRSVALKVFRLAQPVPDDEQEIAEQRFLREASLAASLSHPSIVVVHDVGF